MQRYLTLEFLFHRGVVVDYDQSLDVSRHESDVLHQCAVLSNRAILNGSFVGCPYISIEPLLNVAPGIDFVDDCVCVVLHRRREDVQLAVPLHFLQKLVQPRSLVHVEMRWRLHKFTQPLAHREVDDVRVARKRRPDLAMNERVVEVEHELYLLRLAARHLRW